MPYTNKDPHIVATNFVEAVRVYGAPLKLRTDAEQKMELWQRYSHKSTKMKRHTSMDHLQVIPELKAYGARCQASSDHG